MRLAALAPWWEQGRRWWGDRSARERTLLAVLGGLALVALFLVLVVRPLQAAHAKAEADIRTYDALAQRLRAAGPALAGAQRQPPPAVLVSQSAAAAGLTVARIEPEGTRLRVAFADAPYENVLRWAAELERSSGLRVGEARIDRGTTSAGGVASSFLIE